MVLVHDDPARVEELCGVGYEVDQVIDANTNGHGVSILNWKRLWVLRPASELTS